MTTEQAKHICGNQPTWALRNMVRALSMMSMMNTAEENERKAAAEFLIKERRDSIHAAQKAAKKKMII